MRKLSILIAAVLIAATIRNAANRIAKELKVMGEKVEESLNELDETITTEAGEVKDAIRALTGEVATLKSGEIVTPEQLARLKSMNERVKNIFTATAAE